MDHFIIGRDKTFILANSTGGICVIGTTDAKKQEKNVDDCRGFIKIYRYGTTAGSTGPTMFLLSSKVPKRGINYKFMMNHGASMGSVNIMVETAYMTTKSWEAITPKII